MRLCLICKGGRALCGHQTCPLLPRFKVGPEIEKRISTEFFGPNYNIFVGRIGYPRVGIGPLAAVEDRPAIDSPGNWFGKAYTEIIELRSLMIRSKQSEDVFSRSKFVQENQELALASKPTDIEMRFKKKPVYRVSFSDMLQPMGPTAALSMLRIAENPRISRRVESVVRDELKAAEAGVVLYKRGLDVYKITTILSSGVLGKGEAKRLVPTRWSITATDDMLAKHLMGNIRTYRSINNYMVFEAEYLDNHFVVLFMPGSWEFENFEAWAPGSTWSRSLKETEILEEYEPFQGRTSYAELQGGGYYASRIAAVEALERMKRQARVVVFREIYEGYVIPMGVWVVRETARQAYKNQPIRFSTQAEALKYIDTRLKLPVREYIRQSKVLKQKRLCDF